MWGYWLIPILNLFRPFQIMNGLWKKTDPESEPGSLLGWWWAAWIISSFASRFVSNAAGPDAGCQVVPDFFATLEATFPL